MGLWFLLEWVSGFRLSGSPVSGLEWVPEHEWVSGLEWVSELERLRTPRQMRRRSNSRETGQVRSSCI